MTAEDILRVLKSYSKVASYVDISARENPDVEITADELNHYVQSKGLLSIEDKWIELSRNAASEYLTKLIGDIIHFNREKKLNLPSAEELTKAFFDYFDLSARFFANGIMFELTEYPIEELETQVFYAKRPFMSSELVRTQVEAWNSFSFDIDKDAFGIVAVDKTLMGQALINVL